MLLAIAAQCDFDIIQFNVKTVFLYGDLQEDIYMIPPKGTNIDHKYICKLKKSLYGLKQSSRCWNNQFDSFLKLFCFKQCNTDNCIYSREFKGNKVFLTLYIDDGLILTPKQNVLHEIISELKKNFEITITEPNYFVEMEIIKEKGSVFIHQTNYIQKLVKKFNLGDAKAVSIPSDPHVRLSECSSNMFNKENILYQEAVGCLIFAAIVS